MCPAQAPLRLHGGWQLCAVLGIRRIPVGSRYSISKGAREDGRTFLVRVPPPPPRSRVDGGKKRTFAGNSPVWPWVSRCVSHRREAQLRCVPEL